MTTPNTNLPINPEDLIAQMAGEIRANVVMSGSAIQITKAGKFKMPDGSETDTLEAIIIGYRSRNAFYSKPYKQGDISPPDCWAAGPQDNELLVPSMAKPIHPICNGCPKNEFGSASNGAGKACGNQIRLALMAPDPQLNSDILTLNISATALKGTRNFLVRMTEQHRHPICVITRFTVDSSRGYNRVELAFIGKNEVYEQHLARAQEAIEVLEAPPTIAPKPEPAEPVPTKGSGRAARAQT